jgi:O-antigen ligase
VVTAELARAGGPVACAGVAVLVLAPQRGLRLAGLGAWAVGLAGVGAYLLPSGHRPVYAAAAVVGALGTVAVAWLFLRRPWLVALAALACVPARIPVHVGGTEANLLVPMYGVIAGAATALAWELFRGDTRQRELGPLAWPLAALTAWTGLSLAWSEDLREGAIAIFFFWAPFALLAVSLSRLRWSRRWLTLLFVELGLMAIVFSAIGVYQWITRDVFWNPKVIVANAYAPFYRVNSVFYDPSIYGRFLVVAILAGVVVVLYHGNRRVTLVVLLGIAACWTGLLFSFSQSSFAALLVGTAVAASFLWGWRAAVALGAVAAALLVVALAAPNIRHSLLRDSGQGLNNATSGRASLIENGTRIALAHPVAGVGIGGFKRAYAKRTGLPGREPKKAASHDTPVTVAAETGLPGLGLFFWLYGTALLVTLRRAGASFRGRACLIFATGLVALGVHSLFYNALFEDPTFWGLLGLSAMAATTPPRRWARRRRAAQEPLPVEPKETVTA